MASKYVTLLLSFLVSANLPLCAQQQQNQSSGYFQNGQYLANPSLMNQNIKGANPNFPQQRSGYYYGQYPYANYPGYGYYSANPYVPSYPALGTPVPVSGGMFRFNVGGFSGAYWKAPSGYYYPWGAGAIYAAPPPVIVVEQGASQPAQPSVYDMLKDMSTYIQDQNGKKKFKSDDYLHLARRVKDLQNLESTMKARNGGTLDAGDEEKLRKDCAMLSGDISRRVIP